MRKGLRPAAGVIAVVPVLALTACSHDVTAPRLAAAVGESFTNLYARQQQLLGTSATISAVNVGCVRAGGGAQVGAGDGWSCTVTYVPPSGAAQSVTYDLSVLANGCFHAAGPPGTVGQQTERAADGRSVVNPLFAFDGCFDTT